MWNVLIFQIIWYHYTRTDWRMVQSWQSLSNHTNIPWKENRLKPEPWRKCIYIQGTFQRTSWNQVTELFCLHLVCWFQSLYLLTLCSIRDHPWFLHEWWLSIGPWKRTFFSEHSNICGSVGTRTSMPPVRHPSALPPAPGHELHVELWGFKLECVHKTNPKVEAWLTFDPCVTWPLVFGVYL